MTTTDMTPTTESTQGVTLADMPVRVSPDAIKNLSVRMRQWSGWPRTAVVAGIPDGSPYAHCDMATRTFVVNFDNVVLNPNRVLLSVTPFRLRQEAVLTGVLLHEAAHARHSHWIGPDKPPVHSDGTPAAQPIVDLAMLLEEARVEGLMAKFATKRAAGGLEWTMRAASAALAPTTTLSPFAEQMVMDVIHSWVLRAGRQIALSKHTNYALPSWVSDFNSLLHEVILNHLNTQDVDPSDPWTTPLTETVKVIGLLHDMCAVDETHDADSTMLDLAREVMRTLFPETPPEEMPSAGGGCGAGAPGEDAGGAEPGEQGESGGEDQPEGESAGGGQAEGESEDSEGEPEPSETAAAAQAALSAIEGAAKAEVEADALTQEEAPPSPLISGKSAGGGPGGGFTGTWRLADARERDIARGAGKFLRDLIDPSETSKRSITDMPAATVDGASLSAWKAGGQRQDPRFFIRTRREQMPTPPVKIAIMVDVSSSMESLQKPSALLSWALSSAAGDLRNFAGRGTQVESCLVHWGNTAKVIVPNGAMMPGIREFPCDQGTDGMHRGLDAVEAEMPGFFDPTESPENRLLVQFTDWDLFGNWRSEVIPRVSRLLESGVSMLSVVPSNFSARRSELSVILSQCKIQRGRNAMIQYDPRDPGAVWQQAAHMLR